MEASEGTHRSAGCCVESSTRDGALGMLVVHEQASAQGNSDRGRRWVGWGPIGRRGREPIVIISSL